MQKPQLLRLVVIFIILAASIVAGFLIWKQQLAQISLEGERFTYKTKSGSIDIHINSDFPLYKIQSDSLNQSLLTKMIDEHGYREEPEFLLFEGTQRITPKEIYFRYLDREKSPDVQLMHQSSSNNWFVSGFTADYDNESQALVYSIYYSSEDFPKLLEGESLETVTMVWTFSINEILLLSAGGNLTDNEMITASVQKVVEFQDAEGLLFTLEPVGLSSFFNTYIQNFKSMFTVPSAYAACSGKWACVYISYSYRCPDGSWCPSPGTTVGCSSGTCQSVAICDGNTTAGYSQSTCSGGSSSPDACYAQGATCGSGFCPDPLFNTCSWEQPPPSGGGGGGCPAGTTYCGGCINACRSTYQSCLAWIEQECAPGATPPPACHDANCGTNCHDNPGVCGSTTPCDSSTGKSICWSNDCCQFAPEGLYNCGNQGVVISSPACGYYGDLNVRVPDTSFAYQASITVVKKGTSWSKTFNLSPEGTEGPAQHSFSGNINLASIVNDPALRAVDADGKGTFIAQANLWRPGDDGGWRENRCASPFYISPDQPAPPPLCTRESGTFYWPRQEDASRHILRINYDDSVDGGWRPGTNYPPSGTDSRWDHYRWIPGTMGYCWGAQCFGEFSTATLDAGKQWAPGQYNGYSVQIVDPFSDQPLCTGSYGPFQCGQKKSCTVSTTSTNYQQNAQIPVTVNGSIEPGLSAGRVTQLYLKRQNNTRIIPTPAGSTEVYDSAGNIYYYRFTGCTTNPATGLCNSTINMPGLATTGTYNVFCQMPGDVDQCSGNPNCTYEGGTTSCTGWTSCSNADNKTINVTCSPTCTNACGQPDGCGGTCANTDSGVPTTPTISFSSPSRVGTNVNMTGDADQRVQINWTSGGTRTNNYEVAIYPQTVNPGLTSGSFNCATNQYCTVVSASTLSQLYTPSATHGFRMRVSVRAVNNTCSLQPTPWRTEDFNLTGNITGNFVLDANNTCTGNAQGLVNPGLQSGSTLNATNSVIGSLGNMSSGVSGQTYGLNNYPYAPSSWTRNIILTLGINNPNPADTLVCAPCNRGSSLTNCTRSNNITSPGSTNFYLQRYNLANDPWWQVTNGLFYAGTGFGTNSIPDTSLCTGSACTPYFGINASGVSDVATAGMPLTGASSVSSSSRWTQRQTNPTNFPERRGRNLNFGAAPVENYTVMSTRYDLSSLTKIPANTDHSQQTQLTNLGSQYSINFTEADGKTTRIFATEGDLTISPNASQRWQIPNNEKYIIFVDGSLTIRDDDGVSGTTPDNERLIRVASGGFLAFIVRDNININQNVGHRITASNNPRTQANIEGVYVANNIIIQSDNNSSTTDLKFIGAGSFVGWNSVSLNRDFDDSELGRAFHNTSPTEVFIYRPDFLKNAPTSILQSDVVWQQTND